MKTFLEERRTDITVLIIRLVLGGVIFAHGAQKLFGWFGGGGFENTMSYFTGSVGIPYFLGVLVILGESFGALALAIGFLSRFMASSIFMIMMGALYFDHARNGFFMNWFGNRPGGEGIEFDLLSFGMSLAILLIGSGRYSVDKYFFKEMRGF